MSWERRARKRFESPEENAWPVVAEVKAAAKSAARNAGCAAGSVIARNRTRPPFFLSPQSADVPPCRQIELHQRKARERLSSSHKCPAVGPVRASGLFVLVSALKKALGGFVRARPGPV